MPRTLSALSPRSKARVLATARPAIPGARKPEEEAAAAGVPPTVVSAIEPAVPSAVPSAVPNPLTAGTAFDTSAGAGGAPTPANSQILSPAVMAASRYRDVATTGTPQERAQALADYKASVQYKPPSTATAENLAAAPFSPQATERDWMPTAEQYAKGGWLESPYTIGSGQAQLVAGGGMKVTPIAEEVAGRARADQAARQYHQMLQNAQDLERPMFDAHGRRQKPDEKDLAAGALWRDRAQQHGIETGLLDREHPSADPNIDRATATSIQTHRLARDPSTLTALATPQLQSEARASGTEGGDLYAQIERNKQRTQQASDELARRRALTYSL